MAGVVALVGDRGPSIEAIDEIMSKSDVVALSGAGDEADRIADCIANSKTSCQVVQ